MQQKIQCSVPILTLNAEAHLDQCLSSVRDFADVFLLDGNSTDETRDIARRQGIPVHKQVDTDEANVIIKSFTDMRVKAEQLARFDWILYVDSDEFISPTLAEEIREALFSSDIRRIFSVRKVAILGDRIVRYSFGASNFAPHLYNRRSGVYWKPGKLVHEKLIIPKTVRVLNLSGEIYSHAAPMYRDALQKDDYYLSLTRKKMLAPGQPIALRPALNSLAINFLRAGNIIYKSLKIYLRHGFRESLPPRHVWRYVRYHLIICWYCLEKVAKYK